jgi:hypothetical protein
VPISGAIVPGTSRAGKWWLRIDGRHTLAETGNAAPLT